MKLENKPGVRVEGDATIVSLASFQTPKPPSHHRTLTLEQWRQEAEAKFGSDEHKWAFVCPSCGHVQKVEDFKPFKDAGANEETAFRNCIGRYDGHMHVWIGTRPGPCNYTSGGLFNLNPVTVTTPEGKNIRVFEFAPAAAPAAESAGAR